jgi:hypothetical protein
MHILDLHALLPVLLLLPSCSSLLARQHSRFGPIRNETTVEGDDFVVQPSEAAQFDQVLVRYIPGSDDTAEGSVGEVGVDLCSELRAAVSFHYEGERGGRKERVRENAQFPAAP